MKISFFLVGITFLASHATSKHVAPEHPPPPPSIGKGHLKHQSLLQPKEDGNNLLASANVAFESKLENGTEEGLNYWPPLKCSNKVGTTSWYALRQALANQGYAARLAVVRDMRSKFCGDNYFSAKATTFDAGVNGDVIFGGGASVTFAWAKERITSSKIYARIGYFKNVCTSAGISVSIGVAGTIGYMDSWSAISGYSISDAAEVDIGVGAGGGWTWCCPRRSDWTWWGGNCNSCGQFASLGYGAGVTLYARSWCETTPVYNPSEWVCEMPRSECDKYWF